MPFPPDGPSLTDAGSSAAALPLRGISLLLVEDSRFTCDALRLICQRSGARLKRAETLAAARALLDSAHPDLAIIDLGLPDGPGTDLIASLSATGMPVLAISGDPEGRTAAGEAGAVAFLDKPLPSVAGFVRLIRQLVAGGGADVPGQDHDAPAADPLALRDDLERAAALVAGDPAQHGYATGFVRSLARAVGDPALERAALHAGADGGRLVLSHLIAERLDRLQAAC
ncbi:MAG: response regulator [Tabrizicola sp.]|jgi:CheY-like chemotaxis protein|nr:response regulator [Tabrizicola sp.]